MQSGSICSTSDIWIILGCELVIFTEACRKETRKARSRKDRAYPSASFPGDRRGNNRAPTQKAPTGLPLRQPPQPGAAAAASGGAEASLAGVRTSPPAARSGGPGTDCPAAIGGIEAGTGAAWCAISCCSRELLRAQAAERNGRAHVSRKRRGLWSCCPSTFQQKKQKALRLTAVQGVGVRCLVDCKHLFHAR